MPNAETALRLYLTLIQTPQIKMRIKILALLSLSLAALAFTGCDGGTAQMAPKEANLLGIASIERESYENAGVATFAVSTDELYSRKNFSGDKVTLLWGLITLQDY
ncbi:MAG: hypothetical protein CML13_15225 [Puniceicoccaceae bacterium]|nr:hypothetical protein [Puniceicoccaceae bacterium]